MADMIPVGYMAKRVENKPDFLKNDQVEDIYSVSNCISDKFADYTEFWKHNGYWFFDSPEIIKALATAHDINLQGTKLFYYEVYKDQYDEEDSVWETFKPEKSMLTNVKVPVDRQLEGYDIVSFSMGHAPECSYLSCNHMAETIKVNRHCLIETFDEAKTLLSQGVFKGCEPGPCRIFVVYSVPKDIYGLE